MSEGRLTQSDKDKIIAGVCGGLADYLGIDPVLVRLAFIVLLFASGIGLPIYLILWVIMPKADNLDQPNSEIIQKNIEELGITVSERLGRSGTVGTLFIVLGVYFLFSQFGWLSWLSGGVFWSLLIVGLGVYLLLRRSQ